MKTIAIVVDKDGCTLFTRCGLTLTLVLRAGVKRAAWEYRGRGFFLVTVGAA